MCIEHLNAILTPRLIFVAAAKCGIPAAKAIRPAGTNYLDILDRLTLLLIEDAEVSIDHFQDVYEAAAMSLEFDEQFSTSEMEKHWRTNLNTQLRYLKEYMREHFVTTALRLKSPTFTRTERWYHPWGAPPYSQPDVRFGCFFENYSLRSKDDREKLVDASVVNSQMDSDRTALREALTCMGYEVHTAGISWPLASAWGEDPEDLGENPQGGYWHTSPGSIHILGWTKKERK